MKTQNRNDKCACGSGLKYKNCCLLKEMQEENSKKRQERKKSSGEEFTPPVLINEMLDKLDASSFKDPKKTFLDPCCGNGNFLLEILKRKLQSGHMLLQAVYTIYGIELFQDNVDECKLRIMNFIESNMEVFTDETNERFIDRADRLINRVCDKYKPNLKSKFLCIEGTNPKAAVIYCHNTYITGVTEKEFISNIERILNHHIVCADFLKFDTSTWGGKGQIEMWNN